MNKNRVEIKTEGMQFKAQIDEEGNVEVIINTDDIVLIKAEANNKFTFKLEKPKPSFGFDRDQLETYNTMEGIKARRL